ncbi:MAG: hypothetical protein IJ877_06840 [Candidatus Gastranaerophilales bacterium]|nr:hypothetical protein [Candidatus Gastranaerophilales bacterium]
MKKFFIVLLSLIVFVSIYLCISKPSMHKKVSFSVINYLIKFDTDGSMTTIKQTTTTKIQKEDK